MGCQLADEHNEVVGRDLMWNSSSINLGADIMCIKITSSIIKALGAEVVKILRALDRYWFGAAMLILVILAIGGATAMARGQLPIA